MASKRNKRYQPPNSPGRIVSGMRNKSGGLHFVVWGKHPDFSNIEGRRNKTLRMMDAATVKGVTGTERADMGAVRMREKIRSLQPKASGEAA